MPSPSAYVTTLIGIIYHSSYEMGKIVKCEQCVKPPRLCANTTPKKGKRYTEEADSNRPTSIRQHQLGSFYLGHYHFSFISLLEIQEEKNVSLL